MKICPLCGSAMQDEERFCTSCGNPQETQQEELPPQSAYPSPIAPAPPQAGAGGNPTEPPLLAETPAEMPAWASASAPAIPLPPPVVDTMAQPAPISDTAPDMPPPAPPTASAAQSAYAPAPQPGPAGSMYGAQPAYGQAPQPGPYGAPYGQVPPMPGPMYAQPGMSPYNQSETVSLGEWLLNYLILIVPFANIIMLFVWSFGSSAKPSVKNWARASLIWMAISFVLVMLVFMGLAVFIDSLYYGY